MGRGVYIAGPMRGHWHFNFEAFHAAHKWLVCNTEFTPIFNPAQRDEVQGFLPVAWDLTGLEDLSQPVGPEGYRFDLDAAMAADDKFIRSPECSVVVMLPGWQTSEGARAERVLADSLGRHIQYLRRDDGGKFYLWHEPEPVDHHEPDIEVRLKFEQAAASTEPIYEQQTFRLKASEVHAPSAADMTPVYVMQHAEPVCYVEQPGTEVRVTSPTGGQKGAKPERLGLLPGHALDAVARVYAMGAKKYDANNWRKGYAWSLSHDSLLRHVNAIAKGQWRDEESGEPHLAHAVFHCLALLEWAATGQTDQNDIYGLEVN